MNDDDRISEITPAELLELMSGPLDPAIAATSALIKGLGGNTEGVVPQAMELFSIASGIPMRGALTVRETRRYRPAIDAIVLGLLSQMIFELSADEEKK